MPNQPHWIDLFRTFLSTQEEGDPAHDLQHIERVVLNTCRLAEAENLSLEVLLPAAYLHDCVHVAKDSPLRSQASRLAADHAVEFLRQNDYPAAHLDAIHHAIEAHSFSANITPRTIEAKVLQDADRIDALGATGLSRCLMLGGHMGSDLYNTTDPFCQSRTPDDANFCVDHFFAKLLTLKDTMQTGAGKQLAEERTQFLVTFLDQLKEEIGS
ncbi:MAG: HD domain-containing protein [Verrucomicrobiaceae bacterium]